VHRLVVKVTQQQHGVIATAVIRANVGAAFNQGESTFRRNLRADSVVSAKLIGRTGAESSSTEQLDVGQPT